MKPTTNLDPQRELDGMQQKNRLLEFKNTEYQELTEKLAAAREEYDIAYTVEVTRLKIEGTPITIIKDLAKGNKNVAKLGYKRDVAEGVKTACKESMANARTAIDSYRSRLAWLKAEYFRTE